jgi:hypothetical protein
MTKALALTAKRLRGRFDPLETVRSAVVLSCAAALIGAGPLIPLLG